MVGSQCCRGGGPEPELTVRNHGSDQGGQPASSVIGRVEMHAIDDQALEEGGSWDRKARKAL
jgi:hypothetical protein